MIARLAPYPEYKESGLPWLEHVPKHWDLVPNRGLVRRRKVLVGRRHDQYRLLSLTKQGVIVRDISTGRGKFSSDMGTSQEVRNGDLVFCLFDVPETPRTVGLSRHNGMITGAYTVLEPVGTGRSEYFEWYYRAMDDRKLLSPLYSGLRNTIPTERFLVTRTPQPAPAEQAAIVRFLEWANRRLERAIQTKQKVIALLNEQKQATIHHAVTCGLNPSAPMKPSGIPWFGDIPRHWEVRKVRTCAELIVSNVDKHSRANEEPVRLCNYTDVYKNERITKALDFMRATADVAEIAKFRIHVGDVLLTKDSEDWSDIGVPSYVEHEHDDLVCGYHLAILRPREELVRGIYLLRALQDRFVATQMHVRAKGVTRYGLSHQGIKDVFIPLPQLTEQEAICTALSSDLDRFTWAILRLEREMDLLREYRIRLVADVVTGKLDVREAAARLPKEAPPEIAENDTDLSDEVQPANKEVVV